MSATAHFIPTAIGGLYGDPCLVIFGSDETEHQPREHEVICSVCLRRRTTSWNGVCDRCSVKKS